MCVCVCVCGVYRAQEARRRQRYSAKSRYEAGLWNVNTVTMGGLGGDPEASSDEGVTTCIVSLHVHVVISELSLCMYYREARLFCFLLSFVY